MKIFKRTIVASAFLIAVLFTEGVSAFPLKPKKECKNNTCQTFRVSLFHVKDTFSIRLLMEKEPREKLSVRLLDGRGNTLHQEYVGFNLEKYGRKFNFEELRDGDYAIEISNNSEKITRNIQLRTSKIMEVKVQSDDDAIN